MKAFWVEWSKGDRIIIYPAKQTVYSCMCLSKYQPIKKGLCRTYWHRSQNYPSLSVIFAVKDFLLSRLSRPVEPDVVNIHFARTAGHRHVASSTKANGNTVNIGQNNVLIGKG